jgi:PAS domain S-box-containing protein
LALILAEGGPSQAPVLTKTVLVLYDEHTDLPGLSVLNKSISSTLRADPSFKTEIFTESMNLSRFQREGYDVFLRDHYKEKYKNKKIDVVIAPLGPTLNFALAHMQQVAPSAPIVFCGVDPHEIKGKVLGENVTGILVMRDFAGTLEAALRMQPDTRQVVFVGGSSDFDKQLIASATEQLKAFEDRVAISYLIDQPLDDILNDLSHLPPHTIVLYSTFFKDGAGENFVPHEVATLVSNAANVPVYGFVDQYLGRGIVGGYLYSFDAHGRKAAESALRILHGESASSIPIVEGNTNENMFDVRQLKRWNIDERNLPPGSLVQFKEPTIWEEYRWYIVGLALVFIAESFLLGLLLYLRYRRREAETQNTRLHSRLKEIVSNVPGIVWESRTDPAGTGRRTTFISDYVEKMLGYSPKEWLDQQPGFGLSIIPQDERERVEKEIDEVIRTGKEAVREYRWCTKDGDIRWVENHVAPIFDETHGVVGLRGVALDVTNRKLAEEKARQAEQKDRAILSAIPDVMILQSVEGVFLDYQAKDGNGLFGSPESLLGKNMSDVLPPGLAEQFSHCFERTREDGEPEILEYSLDHEGGRRWFEARMVRVGDKILSVVRDITDLKRTQLEAQEISGRLISAHEDERARIARELHDDACQNLALLSIELELLERNPATDEECIRSKLKVLSERVSELSSDLRRMSHQLHPARLAHLGLATAVRGFCNEVASAHALRIEFVDANIPATLSESTSLNIYRIIQESLQNTVKHSGASEASVILSSSDHALQLTISDNGCGFDPKVAAPDGSLGLISLRERIRLLHGTISIDSRPGGGTRIEATIPIQ